MTDADALRVPLFVPRLGREEEEALVAVIRSGWITMGPRVQAFEERFAALLGRRHAVAVNSCTAALHLANVLLGAGPGDEIIVPSLTFAATANAVVYTGATPVFADISGTDDWCIDPQDVERLITPRTRAVVAMHYAGHPCDMAALASLCEARGIALYEDACHGLGGSLDGRPMGALSALGCFSFFSNKAMTTAEGGMLVTDDPETAARARRLRSHGQSATAIDRMRGARSYDIAEVGFNYRMDDLRAAVGLVQIDRLEAMQESRARLASQYRRRLGSIPGIHVPTHGSRGRPAEYLMPILIETANRDAIREALVRSGVQTSHHYPPVHLFAHYRPSGARLPRTEDVAARSLTLPLYPDMAATDVDYVCDALADAMLSPKGP